VDFKSGLRVFRTDDKDFEVFDKDENWIGSVFQLGETFWDDRINEYQTLPEAVSAIAELYSNRISP
jgi:hypothetical protein